jgi:hypothetical protein
VEQQQQRNKAMVSMGINVGAGAGTGEGVLNVKEDNNEIYIPQTLVCYVHLPLSTPIHRMERIQ